MASIEMRADLSALIDALVAGSSDQIITAARDLLQHGESADVLIGRIGMLAAYGDPSGHTVMTLTAAAMLCRYIRTMPQPLHGTALALFVQAMLVAAPAVRVSHGKQFEHPKPLFPSELAPGATVNECMHKAVYDDHDALLVERLLLGLYGTGADYRTLQVRAYDGIATTFQDIGHPLMFAVRGFQLLDTVEWGNQTPHIIHWLAPHLPLHPVGNEPPWIKDVRTFTSDPAHDVKSVGKRLSAPKDESALALRRLILSNADTTEICQGVYDTLMKGGASAHAISSVIALAAADVVQMVDDTRRMLFTYAAHGLLFASAIRLVFRQVQDVEVLTLLFTSAAYINSLRREVIIQQTTAKPQTAPAPSALPGGGLIAPSQLETLAAQLKAQDLAGALTTARRYLKIGHDTRPLFAVIGSAAAQIDATMDQGHTLKIVQAASESFLTWPSTLGDTTIDGFLQVALRAAAFGKRDAVVSRL